MIVDFSCLKPKERNVSMRKPAFLFFLLFFLSSVILFAAETATLVKVVEGEVYCFDYPEELIGGCGKMRSRWEFSSSG